MLNKKNLLIALLIGSSVVVCADAISDDEMKKALEGITQIKIMESAEPKIISEVKVKSLPAKKKIVKHKQVHHKKVHHKKVHTRKVHKKRVQQDLSDLPIAKTLGVTETSKVFTEKY